MKMHFTLLVCILISVATYTKASDFGEPPLDAINSAKKYATNEHFKFFGTKFLLDNHWLNSGEDIDKINIKLGRGYPSFIINNDKLMAERRNDLQNIIEFVAWSFPIYFDNEYRLSIELRKIGAEWKFYQLGVIISAQEIIKAREKTQKVSGYSYAHVELDNGLAFIAENKDESISVKILQDWAKKEIYGYEYNYEEYSDAAIIVGKLKEMVKKEKDAAERVHKDE